MKKVDLDLTKLLGFKIIACGDKAARLQSPKIGVKNCLVQDELAAPAPAAALAAKIGTKTD